MRDLSRRRSSRQKGHRGEELAWRYLAEKGYETLERNYRTRHGEIHSVVPGARSMAEGAKRERLTALVLPEQNAPEAASIGGPVVYGVHSLARAVACFTGEKKAAPLSPAANGREKVEEPVDGFADVAGKRYAKRALEVTAAGEHNILIFGQHATHCAA